DRIDAELDRTGQVLEAAQVVDRVVEAGAALAEGRERRREIVARVINPKLTRAGVGRASADRQARQVDLVPRGDGEAEGDVVGRLAAEPQRTERIARAAG